MIKSPFLALERDKWRERVKSIRDFEDKGGCEGKHVLSYGSYQEHQQEILLQEQVESLGDKSEQLEQSLSSFETPQQVNK